MVMNDRYLYKAKTTVKKNPKSEFNDVWVEGDLIVSDGKYYIHPRANKVIVKGELGQLIVMHEVDPSTICQCTGYKGIWEHDIFECYDDRYIIVFYTDGLKWQAKSVFHPESVELGGFLPWEINVIGNEIDNPELLSLVKDCQTSRNIMRMRLKKLRKKAGYSYQELEKLTGISHSTLQRYEVNPDSAIPSDKFIVLAKVYGVTVDYLLGMDDKEC